MLDRALGVAPAERRRGGRKAAQRQRGGMVEQLLLGLAPVALVGLVADGEVEALAAAPDRVLQQLAQVCGTRTKPRDLAVIVAREDMIVAVAEGEPEIDRCPGVADVETAEMHERARRGRDVADKFDMTGPREHVRHANARERRAL